MTYYDENQEPGAFPGMDFFSGLTELAKRTTEDIVQIDKTLSSSKPRGPIPSGEDESWMNELKNGAERCGDEMRKLEEMWEHQPDLERTYEIFASTFEWLKRENDRIEKELTKYDYVPCSKESYLVDYSIGNSQSPSRESRPLSPSSESNHEIQVAEVVSETVEEPSEIQSMAMDVDTEEEQEEQKTATTNILRCDLMPPTDYVPTPIKPKTPAVPQTPTLSDFGLEKYMNWNQQPTRTVDEEVDLSFDAHELQKKYEFLQQGQENIPPSSGFSFGHDTVASHGLPFTPIQNSTFASRFSPVATPNVDRSPFASKTDEIAYVHSRKIRHINQSDVENCEVPSYLTSQLGSIDAINSQIDSVNEFLQNSDSISRSQFSELISNEKPLILLLTKWLKLMKSEWRGTETAYMIN